MECGHFDGSICLNAESTYYGKDCNVDCENNREAIKMKKEEAIELLKEEDIKNVIKIIKQNNSKVVYWETGAKYGNDEAELWFIDNEHIIMELLIY